MELFNIAGKPPVMKTIVYIDLSYFGASQKYINDFSLKLFLLF